MARHLPPSTAWLLIPAALVTLIAVLAVGTDDLARGDDLDEDVPAAVVRDFVHAHEQRDGEALRHTLGRELRGGCSDQEIREHTRDHDDVRITLVSSEEVDDVVEVEVRHTRYGGEPPFGDATYETREVFVLEQEDHRWVITEIPWILRACGGWHR